MMMKSGKHDQDNKRRKKLKALRAILQSYRDRLGESCAPDELKIIDGVLYRLNRGDWPRRNLSDAYLYLGQFTHWTLTVPASMTGLLQAEHHRLLVEAAGQLVRSAAGSEYEPAYRIVAEQQSKSDQHLPFHLHVAVSCHRFRQADRELAGRFQERYPVSDFITEFLQPIFSVPLLLPNRRMTDELSSAWAKSLHKITGVEAPASDKLVEVTTCKRAMQTQEDRRNLALYHASPLKTLMDDLDFYRPEGKGAVVRVVYHRRGRGTLGAEASGPKGFTLSMEDFVRRYVVQPMTIPVRAVCCGALSGNSIFNPVLRFASENGFLDRPASFFQLLSEGMTWRDAHATMSEAA